MGTFTLPLKKVIEMENGKIGLDDYPIFSEDYRASLNRKITDHYWNQEIGQESIELFRFAMRRKMNEIMPLYNQHYVLSLKTADPLSTVSIRNIADSLGDTLTVETSTSSTDSTAKSRAVGSDFPQMMLSENGDYATSGTDNISDATATGTGGSNGDTKNTAHTTGSTEGYQGHAPLLIMQARQALVNVDMLVIEELQELFMLIWANNDSFTGRTYYGIR